MVELHVVAVATQVRFLGGAPFYIARVVSSVVRIPAFQAGGPGSIPGRRTIFWAGPSRTVKDRGPRGEDRQGPSRTAVPDGPPGQDREGP